MSDDVSELRQEYGEEGLEREHLNANPFTQFRQWFEEARAAEVIEPNAMSLTTVSAEGMPALRTVLLKAYDERGFVFFTNYRSAKARDIGENPNVALLFPWLKLERQVIVRGQAEKISTAESLKYFVSRPIGSQVGAWVSDQSQVISSRKVLEMKWAEMKRKFSDGKVPLPDFWGGYRVVPAKIEFWQGRKSRLHDRFLYTRGEGEAWTIERLSP